MGSQRVGHDWATEQQQDLGCGFPDGTNGKESTCQCRRLKRHSFHPWVWKIPWSRKWQPTPVYSWKISWTEEPGRLQSMRSQRIRHEWSCVCTHIHTHTHLGQHLFFGPLIILLSTIQNMALDPLFSIIPFLNYLFYRTSKILYICQVQSSTYWKWLFSTANNTHTLVSNVK